MHEPIAPSAPVARGRRPARNLAPANDVRWSVNLLGGISLDNGVQRIERLPSRAAAVLLARLALWPARVHPREELVELIWPGVELPIGRNRLRQVLSTLKGLLEAPGQPPVLLADRHGLRVTAATLACDAREFEALLRERRIPEARVLYGGELMPGHYDEWILDERARLSALAERLDESRALLSVPLPARPALPAAAPPATAGTPGHRPRLPVYVTRLFGIDAQARNLHAQVLAQRLVTLQGPGGSGKTRLAVEVAQRMRDRTAASPADPPSGNGFDLVVFVPLVSCTTRAQVIAALAAALRSPSAGIDGPDALVALLGDLGVLLVLDNFEQVVDEAALLVAELLGRLPTLHVLATSRRALGIDGEVAVAMSTLPLPDAKAPLSWAADNPAVALFVDRARGARSDFHLSERNAPAIVAVVRALHGIPLAIELAASRIRSFSPGQMLAVLESAPGLDKGALDLLARSGSRSGTDPRHASMRQTVAWSWQLLSHEQQRALQGLTVFEGGFSAESAAAVLGRGSVHAARLWLHELAGHSLVRSEAGADDTLEFSLYEPVRDFVAEQLAPDGLRGLRAQLRQWLVAWARALGPAAPPAQVELERTNVRTALRTAVADGATLEALQLTLALRAYWDTDGMAAEQVSEIESALDVVSLRSDAHTAAVRTLRCNVHELLAYLRFESGSRERAAAHAQAALSCAGDDPSCRARAMVRSVWLDLVSGADIDPAALLGVLQEAMALATASGDLEGQARALHQMAVVQSNHLGAPALADQLLERSQALWEHLGDRSKVIARLRNRAQCWSAMGRRDEALAIYESCEATAAANGDWMGRIDASLSCGSVLANMRRWPEAAHALARCTRLCWDRHQVHGLSYALWNQARVMARLRRPETAARLMAFAEHFWVSRIGPLTPHDRSYLRRVRGLVLRQLGPAQTEALWTDGRLMSLPQAVSLACAEPVDTP